VTENGRRVVADGLEVYVRERGDGTPLLLLNGIGGNAEMWGALEDRLAAVARTIVFDAPGSGRSQTPRWPLRIPGYADVTSVLLDELGYDRVDVLGFSFGGLVAQELAHRHPERVRRLALVSTACGWGSKPGTLASLVLISMPFRYHSRVVYERTNQLLSPADHALVERLPQLAEARLSHPPPLLGYGYQLGAGMLWTSLPWLHTVDAPTLVLAGGLDHLVPSANGLQLARLLPRARLQVLPDEGHLFVLDPESEGQALLEGFFAAAEPEASHAWATGRSVDDDETVEAAFAAATGSAQPHGVLSDAYRRSVLAARES
jgi:poly(3-hydroxyoctanoate) depolymerase